MAVTFVGVASLATVGGSWAVRANQFGRIAALALFAAFGITSLFSSLAEDLYYAVLYPITISNFSARDLNAMVES
jgi:hypothetical protein